ncbi:MAG: hypothetical protein WBD50_06005 [Candidatus Rhabdochlamydia sp.]
MSVTTIATTIATAAMLASPIYTTAADTDTTCTSSEYAKSASFIDNKDSLIREIYYQVMKVIEHPEEVHSLDKKAFKELQEGLKQRWNELVEKGSIEVIDTDEKERPYYVTLQAIVEHVLTYDLSKEIKSLKGAILTPMPATPLCTEGQISPGLINPDMKDDPRRLLTVESRPTIIRDYLYQDGELDICYPRKGIDDRSKEQQEIYQKAKKEYPSLSDHPLDCEKVRNDLIGAFYLFKNDKKEEFGFAIKATQANDAPKIGSFGLWFDKSDLSTATGIRISEMEKFIKEHSFPSSS